MEGSSGVEASACRLFAGGSGEGLLGPKGRLSEECCDKDRDCRGGDAIGGFELESDRGVAELRLFVSLEVRESGRRGGSSILKNFVQLLIK
jgi:hypothetical protein